jgi:hypothetical protein
MRDPLGSIHRFDSRSQTRVKKLAIAVLLVCAACKRQVVVGSPPPGATANVNAPGAPNPREAVRMFLAAAKDGDVQAFSMIWGSAEGPARGSRFFQSDTALEQRAIFLMTCLKHDSYRIVSEGPAAGGERLLNVELKYKTLTGSTDFMTAAGPKERWFVRHFEPKTLQHICVAKAG